MVQVPKQSFGINSVEVRIHEAHPGTETGAELQVDRFGIPFS